MRKIWLLLTLQLLSLRTIKPEERILNRSAQEISRVGIKRVAFDANSIGNGRMYYTNLDRLRNVMLAVRNASLNAALRRMDQLLASNRAEGKLQKAVPAEQPFPCNLSQARSAEPPDHIWELRPGDIDITAAFGDSVIAGNGLLSQSYLDIVPEFRGYSFLGGGLGNWRTALTLPNLLKLYNPQLYGYARTHGLVADRQKSVFNIAEPMLTMRDLPYQAHVLIERLQSDPRVHMQQHWKLLNIQVGMNDMCFELCSWNDTEQYLRLQRQQAYRAFSMLRDHVPRLMINWILLPDLDDLLRTLRGFPGQCNLRVICSCLTVNYRAHYPDAVRRLQRMQWELAALPEFRRSDFVIVPHRLLANLSGIVYTQGGLSTRYFSHDCMHFSQRMHAIMAGALWNSMLQPLNATAARAWRRPLQNMLCPSAERPFLRIS